jgi:hypothetical protein
MEEPSAHVLERNAGFVWLAGAAPHADLRGERAAPELDGVALLIGPDASGAKDVRTSLEGPTTGSDLELGDRLCWLFPSHWSSNRPFRIATDKMRMADTMNSLRFVARSFAPPRACRAAQRSSKP